MDIVKFVNVNQLTDTGRLLTSMIFNKKSLSILHSYGLMNVYLDDYGCSKRYEDCLFFLFNSKNINNYDEFEKTLANFKSSSVAPAFIILSNSSAGTFDQFLK